MPCTKLSQVVVFNAFFWGYCDYLKWKLGGLFDLQVTVVISELVVCQNSMRIKYNNLLSLAITVVFNFEGYIAIMVTTYYHSVKTIG